MPSLRQLSTVDFVKIYDPAGRTEHPAGRVDSIPDVPGAVTPPPVACRASSRRSAPCPSRRRSRRSRPRAAPGPRPAPAAPRATAPDPSPRRRPRSTSGPSPSCSQRCGRAGLDRPVPRDPVADRVGREGLGHQGRRPGDHAVEHHGGAQLRRRPAGTRSARRARGRRRPPAPAAARAGPASLTLIACRTTATLWARPASSMPVPRPVTSAGSRPVKALTSAAEAVVLAMPMSPVTSSRCAVADQVAGHA